MVTLTELIAKFHEIFADDHVDVDEVIRAMESYKSNKAEWRRFAVFDEHKYTRNLVDEGNGKYNLMLLCWGPGMGSSIHDHTDSHCFVKILDGALVETKYDWPDDDNKEEPMRKIDVNRFEENGVSYMNDKLGLHRMENPSHSDGAVSLHLYIPAYSTCNAFDERTGKKTKCQVTFYTKYGSKVDYRGSKNGNLVDYGSTVINAPFVH
ncbi:cysteine dioxygenase type I [Oesophagostomum dentatum]|uniref:Cysteine dioxygenase n=1 Tax=Oesophagostomum dentatum TaxID=61180 RepID=A0A0B1TP17_OESDE|nr:cysteine dioxygenase type I [Oesophagostomum dentatum]